MKQHINKFKSQLSDFKSGCVYIRKKTGRDKIDILLKSTIITPNYNISPEDDYVSQFKRVSKKIIIKSDQFYIYPYDPMVQRVRRRGTDYICSNTVDYSKVLDSSFDSLKARITECKDETFKKSELATLEVLNNITLRIQKILSKKDNPRAKMLYEYFTKMKDSQAQSFDEAIQRILFYNALCWQMDHWHVGIGRLDLILYPYYMMDVKNGNLCKEEAKNHLKEMISVLGSNTKAKSLSIDGDTGQYILLGGSDQQGNVVQNELTELFLEIFTEMTTPDPKLILRVNNRTSNEIWVKAVSCLVKGSGSPLLINDDLLMKRMTAFGYKPEDVWNFGTSACWEPLIIGKSFDQNNPLPSITIIKSLNKAICDLKEECTYDSLIAKFKIEACAQIKQSIRDIHFDISPLYSLYFDSCIEKERDYSNGGAVYSFHGVQFVSFPNLINGLLNIKKYVFDKRIITLSQCKDILIKDFHGYEDVRELFLTNNLKYGSTNEEVVNLTNEVMKFLSEEVGKYTINGERLKMGFSSPQYITNRNHVKTSLDGRKGYEPFAVHISPVSANIDISEILDFASQLNYEGNRINGNVVDFILPSSYVKQQDKLISLLRNACDKGLFEIQLNVLDKTTLIDAKANPEKYPNLIVRVWGFSAYFNDLPEDYKDNLIQRAQTYEA